MLRRAAIVASWPAGIALTAWDYTWRTTPIHRREVLGTAADDSPPRLPDDADGTDLQPAPDGVGPLFHRTYRTHIRGSELTPEELIARIADDLNGVAPTAFARFVKTAGAEAELAVGDEFVVRMPGPWDGPVRVVAAGPTSFRLATLDGHLEAGQIEFRASRDTHLEFAIEAWARSGDRLSHLLYRHLRFAKETQLHMWISVLERVVKLSGGRMTGGIDVETRRLEVPPGFARLKTARINYDPTGDEGFDASSGWHVDDLCQPLPAGSFEAAKELMTGYGFADPSIVRAYYDRDAPLEGRTMLLEVQYHRLRLHVGVRVSEVIDRVEQHDGRDVRVWGWAYRTLEGHFEQGQMDWQVWEWLDTGAVEFRIHAYSRPSRDPNLVIQAGLRVVGPRERRAFLRGTMRRMAELVPAAASPASRSRIRTP